MSQRDWTSIDAAIEALDRSVDSVDLPGNHPELLSGIEGSLRTLETADVAKDKCAGVRTAARAFYADRGRRSKPMSEVNSTYQRMVKSLSSIRLHIVMLKAAE